MIGDNQFGDFFKTLLSKRKHSSVYTMLGQTFDADAHVVDDHIIISQTYIYISSVGLSSASSHNHVSQQHIKD